MRYGVRLGLDPGDARIGVACCDPAAMIATPVETVARGAGDLARVRDLVTDSRPIEIVVGLPISMNGTEGPAAAKVREFGREVAALVTPVPVRLVDERLSTVSAHSALRASGRKGKRHRQVVDQVAAVVILQHALDTERASGIPPGSILDVAEAKTPPDSAETEGLT